MRIVLVFVFIKLTIFSQKVNFEITFTPEFNSLTLSNLVGQEVVYPKMGLSAGLNLEYRLTKKCSIKTGVGYGLKNYNHTHSGLIFSTDIDPQTGITSESKIVSKIIFSEIQIPIILKYWVFNKLFLTGGIELVCPFANSSERVIYYGNGTTEKISNSHASPLNLAPTFSLGYGFAIKDKLRMSIEPMFKY